MSCETYKRLEKDLKFVREEWAYFAYDENKALRGTSDRKSKQMAKAAKEKMADISKRIGWHRQGCELCKNPSRP